MVRIDRSVFESVILGSLRWGLTGRFSASHSWRDQLCASRWMFLKCRCFSFSVLIESTIDDRTAVFLKPRLLCVDFALLTATDQYFPMINLWHGSACWCVRLCQAQAVHQIASSEYNPLGIWLNSFHSLPRCRATHKTINHEGRIKAKKDFSHIRSISNFLCETSVSVAVTIRSTCYHCTLPSWGIPVSGG